MAENHVKVEFSEEALEAMEKFKQEIAEAREQLGTLTHDENLRLAAMSEAIKFKQVSSPLQLPTTAGVIESYIRYGRLKDVQGYTTLGPECFIDPEGDVISFKGENFYRACGNFVRRHEGGGNSTCVKRVGHDPEKGCEDWDGHQGGYLK